MTRRLIFSAALIGVAIAAVFSQTSAQIVRGWDECEMADTVRIKGSGTLFPGGELDCTGLGRETGSYDGVGYMVQYNGWGYIQAEPKYFPDGARWHLECNFDDIDGDHSCFLSNSASMLNIAIVGRDQTPAVIVGLDHTPGSRVALKVDDNRPWKSREDIQWSGDDASEILEMLETGEKVVVAYTEWPSKSEKQEVSDLWGLRQALEVLRRVHSRVTMSQ